MHAGKQRRFLLIGPLLLMGSVLRAEPGERHEPSPLWLEIGITEHRVTVDVWMMAAIFAARFPGDEARARVGIEAWLGSLAPIAADDRPVTSRFTGIDRTTMLFEGTPLEYVRVRFSAPLTAIPDRLAFSFDFFPAWRGRPLDFVDGLVHQGRTRSIVTFSPSGQRAVWERSAVTPPMPFQDVIAPRSTPRTLPTASLILIATSLVLAFWLRRSRLMPVALVIGMTAAAWAYDTGGIPLPPSESEAKSLFGALHYNVYRAFDHRDPEDVYDALADSATGPLLERLFLDVTAALSRPEDGASTEGSTIHIDDVTIEALATTKLTAQDITVDATWTVKGRVGHWAHEHRRAHRATARFEVTRTEKGWRLSGYDVESIVALEAR